MTQWTTTPPSGLSRRAALVLAVAAGWSGLGLDAAKAATGAQLAADSRAALEQLFVARPETKAWAKEAKAILVFPSIVKAGALVGGQTGDGAMLTGKSVAGFYRIAAASYGLQLGVQHYAYALFFMNQGAVDYLEKSQGWSVGAGPSLVLVDDGVAKSMTSTTLTKDVYAVAFGQKGLMAGAGLEGSKITEIHPAP